MSLSGNFNANQVNFEGQNQSNMADSKSVVGRSGLIIIEIQISFQNNHNSQSCHHLINEPIEMGVAVTI